MSVTIDEIRSILEAVKPRVDGYFYYQDIPQPYRSECYADCFGSTAAVTFDEANHFRLSIYANDFRHWIDCRLQSVIWIPRYEWKDYEDLTDERLAAMEAEMDSRFRKRS